MPADTVEPPANPSPAISTAVVAPVCTACGSTSVRRSRRRLLDQFATLFGYYPYRCRECNARFILKPPPRPRTQHKSSRSESRARRRTALRRELLVYGLALISFALLIAFLVRDHD